LRGWYAEAQAAGVPFCEYLMQLSQASLSGVQTGGERLISTTTSAGHSVTYAPSSDQPVNAGTWNKFLADCAVACPYCIVPNPSTDEDYLECLIATQCAPPVSAYQKPYVAMRQ
jgi:hypothetical protein